MITLEDYLMGRDIKYPADFNQTIVDNANHLLTLVNGLLDDLQLGPVVVSSGWRPPAVNSACGGASHSYHLTGGAVDLVDDHNSTLDGIFASNPDLLRKHGLWLESSLHTPGWSHLDFGSRQDRPTRVFIP